MASKSDLQSAAVKWKARIAQARTANLPESVWKPLMQKDFNSIFQGHSPMADAEVNDAMRASVGLSPIKDPGKGHGILDVLGNIPSDIQNIVTGFIPGIVGYVTSLPEQASDLQKLLSHDPATLKKYGWENPDDLGSFLRDMSKAPIIGPLVPGLRTISESTTPEGRQWLEEHPVSTVIDVGAAVAAAGKLGLFGKAAAVGEEAAGAEAAATATTPLEELKLAAEEKPPLAALQRGEPYRALGRGTLKAVEKVSGERISRPKIEEFLFNHAAHPILREWLTRPYDQINTLNEMKHRGFLGGELIQTLDNLSEDDANLLNQAGQTGNMALLKDRPDLEALANASRNWIDSMAREHPLLRQVMSPWGRSYTYTKNHPVVRAFDSSMRMTDERIASYARYQNAFADYQDKLSRLGADDKVTRAAFDRQNEAAKSFNFARKAEETAAKHYHNTLATHAPAAFYPFLDQAARERATDFVKLKYGDDQAKLNVALGRIRNSTDWEQLGRAIDDPAESARISREVESTWTALARDQGVDPIYLPNLHESKVNHLLNPTIFPDVRYARTYIFKNTSFNLSRSVYDFKVGLVGYHQQMLVEAGQRAWVDNYVRHFVKPAAELHDDLTNAMSGPGMVDVRNQVLNEMETNWVRFVPDTYGMAQYFPSVAGGDLMIPKGVQTTLDWMKISKKHPLPVQSVKDKSMNVWRFSVLTTPRHISHVVLGGMTMGTLQDPLFLPHFIQHYSEARAIMNGDDLVLRAKFGRNTHNFSTDQLFHVGSAKSLGRINTSIKHPFDALNRWEESVTTMYKITTMLTQEAKGVERDQAIAMANKFFVDRSAMLPIERVSMNKIFPFYGFTRHLFRYLMTYPSDHPYVASILTHFANQHEADWNSGLARNLSFMFFLGQPDKDGNVTAVDYRSIDPFRSFYNDFTLAGFWSQINPGLQFIAQESGLNILSGTQELYPNIHYDPNTGQLVADRPSNFLLQGLETLVPETTAAEAYFGLTDQMRNLKISDPAAYRHRVLTSLGLPFYPETFNVAERVQTAQMKRYRDAQTSISQALQTGDFSKAKRYDYVPVPSLLAQYLPAHMKYISPQAAEYVYNALLQRFGDKGQVSLHAILPKPTRTRTG